MIKRDRVSDGRHLMEQEIGSLAGLPSVCVTINGAEFSRLFETLAGEVTDILTQGPGLRAVSRMGRHDARVPSRQPVSV